jgi:DNA repair exonuclease SbcCD ATPase subunit
MSDEETIEQEAPEPTIWELLEMDPPEGEEEDKYEHLQDDADEDTGKASKMEKKLSAKMDDMQKKFEQTIMRDRITNFEDSADEMHKDLFKAIAGEVKDVESLDKALAEVNKRAEKLKEQEEKYKAQLEAQAQAQVAQAWGTGPMGTPTPRTPDQEEETLKKIAAGDTHALFEDLMTDNWPSV